MKETVQKICKQLEKQHSIKILFAIENGSRAWRMESKDSDYDVRFVFLHPVENYLSLEKPIDVINHNYDAKGKECSQEETIIDVSGFDIFKFLTLLAGSNPTTIEWLTSDIVYYGTQNKTFKKFALNHFNQNTLYYHYQSLCKQNYLKYLKTGSQVTYKKYLYTYRGLLNAVWVKENGTIPPINFQETLEKMTTLIPKSILEQVKHIIKLKQQGKEKETIQNLTHMDDYIEKFLKEKIELEKEYTPKDIEILNKELLYLLLKRRKPL